MHWRRVGLGKAVSRGVKNRISIAWPIASTSLCCWESYGRRSVGPTTVRGGGGLLPGDVCTKTKLPVAEVLQDNHPGMHVPPVENPTCMAFEEY